MIATQILRAAAISAFLFSCIGMAQAQIQVSPHAIQAEIAAGNSSAALNDLRVAIQIHPHSGIAWYLEAEAQDASGNTDAARYALRAAEQYAPGLPFASQSAVADLRSHLATLPAVPAVISEHGFGHILIYVGVLIGLTLVSRMFIRVRRPAMSAPSGYGSDYPDRAPTSYNYGGAPVGGMSYGYQESRPGLGDALVTGLAEGAGMAVGQRMINDVMGGENRYDSGFGRNDNVDIPATPDRDDGLLGSPGWEDNSSSRFDSGDSSSSDSW